MLSYQHGFHAGNLADVHKHWALAWMLSYLTKKPKPLSYIETHGGRGLYDLRSEASLKTGEAAAGIEGLSTAVAGTPYGAAIAACRAAHGDMAYPGSPWIAAHLLRPEDHLHIAELHPTEHGHLRRTLPAARVAQQDGFEMAHSVCPPDPRRGLLLVDPSFEVKADYEAIPKHFDKIAKAWPVGILALWYPVLTDKRHDPMLSALGRRFPEALRHEVQFPPVREGHRMVGSGLFVVNPPWGLSDELGKISSVFDRL